MDIKQKLKKSNILIDNIYLATYIRKVVYLYDRLELSRIFTYCNKLNLFSSQDINEFTKIANYAEKRNFKSSRNESFLYGHLNALYDYAGISKINEFSIPALRHGLIINPDREKFWSDDVLIHDVLIILLGNICRKALRKAAPYKPMFTIGPMIHYARSFYDESAYIKLKKKYGKTLLYFPTHSIPTVNLKEMTKNDYKIILGSIKKYQNNYDTIMISVFWHDLDNPLYKILESEGYTLVCAGLPFDPNFIRRLKSSFELADAVTANSIGTYIGYSLAMKKPFKMIDNNIQYDWESEYWINRKETKTFTLTVTDTFKTVFANDNNIITKEQLDFIEPYWGLSHIKTKNEVKSIIEIANFLLNESKGSIQKYYENTRKLKEILDKGNVNNLTDVQCNLLREALN